MTITIRDMHEHDLDSVLALNNAAGATILPLDNARLRALAAQAAYFRVAEADGHLAGFLIAPLPGPLGVPLTVVGLMLVLRNSSRARKQFVRFQHAHPKLLFPLRLRLARRRY